MSDEIVFEAEEDDDDGRYSPEQTDVCAGTFVIFDTEAFAAALNCIAVQVTDEGGVYVVDADTHKLRPLQLDTPAKSGLSRVK